MIACTATEAEVTERLETVRTRIERAGGDPESVTVMAVTKGFDARAVELAQAVGLADVGENYAQELVAKSEALAAARDAVRWHCIGRLQRNKVRSLATVVDVWQSVDRAELGAEIARRAPGAHVLAQVNVSGEEQKGGCDPVGTAALVADLVADGLVVEGLMCVAATDPAQARDGFATLRRLADELALPVRSMGMSGDLEAAVAEGSTMVRIGTALFGTRAPQGSPSSTKSIG